MVDVNSPSNLRMIDHVPTQHFAVAFRSVSAPTSVPNVWLVVSAHEKSPNTRAFRKLPRKDSNLE